MTYDSNTITTRASHSSGLKPTMTPSFGSGPRLAILVSAYEWSDVATIRKRRTTWGLTKQPDAIFTQDRMILSVGCFPYDTTIHSDECIFFTKGWHKLLHNDTRGAYSSSLLAVDICHGRPWS